MTATPLLNLQHETDQCSPIHFYWMWNKQRNQCNLTPKQITFMCQFFLVNQKHAVQPVLADSQTNDSYSKFQLFLVNQKYAAQQV